MVPGGTGLAGILASSGLLSMAGSWLLGVRGRFLAGEWGQVSDFPGCFRDFRVSGFPVFFVFFADQAC